jgi:AbrB family looped-hinge helix DNA binding protein
VRLGAQGRVTIPSEIRRALGFQEGETLVANIEDGRLVLETRGNILKRLQEHFAGIASEISLADELIAERHEEAT